MKGGINLFMVAKIEKYKTSKRITKPVIEKIIEIEKTGLTAEKVVAKARDKNSPLHKFFEWDDTHAAKEWRIQQARVLIHEIKVVIEDKEYVGFQNVTVQTTDGSQRLYLPVREVVSNKDLREQILQRALNQQEYWADEFNEFKELSLIFQSIKKTKNKLNSIWQKKKRNK